MVTAYQTTEEEKLTLNLVPFTLITESQYKVAKQNLFYVSEY
jgi:hypothetical protein